MRTTVLAVSSLAIFVPVTLYIVTLWLWLETGSGEANFTFFQCLAYNAFLSAFVVEFCGASVRRDKALRLTEKIAAKGYTPAGRKDGSGETNKAENEGTTKASTKGEGHPADLATDLNALTIPELKELLRARGLKVSGRKAELIERLTS